MNLPQNKACLLSALLFALAPLRAENWPQFRGPTGLGYTSETALPVQWGGAEGENVLWKAPLKGDGHASPIVWDGRVLVCTALWPPEVKERTKTIPEHHVLAYAASDGKLLWDALVPPGPWLRDDFRSGSGGGYAAPTPCTDGRLVFAAFGSAVIAAIDWNGNLVWRKDIVPFTFDVTIGASPILFADTVILFCAMAKKEDSRIVAFDKATGDVRWEAKLPAMGFGHSTPVIIEVKGKAQMVVNASGMETRREAIQSLDPETGRRIWWCEGAGDASSPAFGSGIIYADSGRGSPGWAIDPTGEGDVTATHVRWKVPQVPEGISSPVIAGGQVYRLHNPGIVKCWKASTGERVFSARLEGLSSTWASPIADPVGRIFFATAGKSFVIQAGPELKVLATNDLGDPNHASPAVAGGRMFLVGRSSIYCVGLGTADEPAAITHSLLVTGARTCILEFGAANEKIGKTIWQYAGSTRDGWVLPSGNVLLAVSKCDRYPGGAALELTRDGRTVFEYRGAQDELNSVQKLDDGNVVVTEAGPHPRLLELDAKGKTVVEFPLQCQKENFHMQTRMARKLARGTYLVPHLLDFAIKEYDSKGNVLQSLDTTFAGSRDTHTWPFTAIRLLDGNTLIGCTHGNRVVEVDAAGKAVWELSNDDLKAAKIELKDCCGVQRLPNGNTVVTNYAAGSGETRLVEVTRDKKVVWTYSDNEPQGIHHFQILDTNGRPLAGTPLK